MKIQEHICTVNSRTASTVNVFVQRKLQTGVRRNGSNVPQKKKKLFQLKSRTRYKVEM